MNWNRYEQGDALDVLKTLPDRVFNTCVTSPPYWGLRDYGHEGQIGLEETPGQYVERMVSVFREVRRVLRDDGTLWLNLGDSYASNTKGTGGPTKKQLSNNGSRFAPIRLKHDRKGKDLVGIPWRVAFALQADGWYLRSDIIWHKPNPMPESVRDRPTKAHEYVFLLSKSARYYYEAEAISERASQAGKVVSLGSKSFSKGQDAGAACPPSGNGLSDFYEVKSKRNKRSVWTVPSRPYTGAHFACYPPDLIKPCILAGCPKGGVVLDPFLGSGTTGQVAESLGRRWYGIELNPEYCGLIRERTAQIGLL